MLCQGEALLQGTEGSGIAKQILDASEEVPAIVDFKKELFLRRSPRVMKPPGARMAGRRLLRQLAQDLRPEPLIPSLAVQPQPPASFEDEPIVRAERHHAFASAIMRRPL